MLTHHQGILVTLMAKQEKKVGVAEAQLLCCANWPFQRKYASQLSLAQNGFPTCFHHPKKMDHLL